MRANEGISVTVQCWAPSQTVHFTADLSRADVSPWDNGARLFQYVSAI
jgi:hypothetical protein